MVEEKNFTFEEQDYVVKRPSMKELDEANKVYNKTFSQAINSGAIIRERLEDILREQGLWSDNKEMQYRTLRREVLDSELKLKKGGIKLVEGKQIALNIKETRTKMVDMLMARSNLDSNTAEGQADNMRFNYLVSTCLVYKNTGRPYYKNLEDYLNQASQPLAVKAARQLYTLLYDQDENAESNLPENKFLKRFEFVDEKLRLIDNNGHLVDEAGRLINEEGRFVNMDGNFVDIDGNPVTEEGEYLVDELPFLDEEGNPVLSNEESTKKKSSRKKVEAK
jgi:hypothetical protein